MISLSSRATRWVSGRVNQRAIELSIGTFPACYWAGWSVIRRRTFMVRRLFCLPGLGGSRRFDKTVIPAHPIVHEPANRRRDALAVFSAVVLQGRAAAPFCFRFTWRNRPRAAAIRHISALRDQVGTM